jgi:hypothetical protein
VHKNLINKWLFLSFAALSLTPLSGFTLDLSPWYPPEFEIQGRATYLYQHFTRVASSHHSFKYVSNDQFGFLDAGVAYYDWFLEAQLTVADTRHRSFGVDNFSLMGRYKLADDVSAEDPFSIVVSAIITTATTQALRDIGSFHHGKFEGLCTLSIGKEFPCGAEWLWHLWAVGGIGIADVGSPWYTTALNIERNFLNGSRWGGFIDGLFGTGGDDLKSRHHFRGYGPLQHRSIDLGIFYTRLFDSGSKLTLNYSRRVYARNFPEQTDRILISFLYPFSL